ncbi:ABC transporter ATP-binding protein [Parenemella sanctibonifatiensis]|uniref:Multidrug ABC transporter ATP-binding protein n=1 Tax=Parenemella sanctibonifatiensis TaxID=2016505 RepID=A0A255ETQ2_9ACTN|nr:ABC transporter ATP-binding protein [Parenemella sanctibonifatiensis]OYN91493.1 multidrug ABC transporter ATP-binding protein [Parenemella sanctibonifatiensis]
MLIRLLRHYLRPYAGFILALIGVQLVAAMASLYLPSLNGSIIDDGVAAGNIDHIWRTGGVMLAVSLVQIAGQITAAWLGARVAMAMGRDVRAGIFHRVLSFSARDLNQFGAPSLITRNTNDVQQIQQMVVMASVMLVSAPITMIGGTFMALREDIGLSWLVVVAVVTLAAAVGTIVVFMGPLFTKLQNRIDIVNRVLREQITGIRVVRAFVREEHEAARFDRANADLTDTTTKVGRLMATMFPVVMLILNVSSVGVLWFGGHRVASGAMQVGQLTAFLQYLTQILFSVMMATMVMVIAPRAAVCAKRIMEVLDTRSSVVPASDPRTPAAAAGRVEFRNVSFTYPGAEEPVLRELTFTAEPGRTTAIIGATGTGKTTLLNLIPRLIDATDGEVVVDGVPVTELAPEELWSRVGLIPQRSFLFTGTVASNLRYGRPEATDEELWEALRIAQADDFVSAFPDGLDHKIAQGGSNVSGGQRQRLSIARALVARPPVLLFDDSFSALDLTTDSRLRRALDESVKDATRIVVAQRVSTITDADLILVMDNGEIVARGSHEELLESSPTYAEIVDSQLSAEEAA